MMLISIGEKGSYFKPAFFEFINDDVLYKDYYMNRYIMAGCCLYYIPNLKQSEWSYKGYFPNWNFNKFPSGEKVFTYDSLRNKGYYLKLKGDYDILNIYIKGGSIMPYQNVLLPTLIKSSNDLRNRNIDLIINPDHFNKASGDIFYDMDQVDIIENNDYNHIKIFFSGYSINFNLFNKAITPYENYTDNIIENIKIFRAENVIAQIGYKITFAEVYEINGNFSIYNINVDKNKDEIVIKDLFKEIDKLQVINLR
jgi:alpha-glucosidase (family GH31 glycosyl hydrolase)